jgi:hypothetical protein
VAKTVIVINSLSVKVKVKLSLCFFLYHAMKAYWGADVELHTPAALPPVKEPLVPT